MWAITVLVAAAALLGFCEAYTPECGTLVNPNKCWMYCGDGTAQFTSGKGFAFPWCWTDISITCNRKADCASATKCSGPCGFF